MHLPLDIDHLWRIKLYSYYSDNNVLSLNTETVDLFVWFTPVNYPDSSIGFISTLVYLDD